MSYFMRKLSCILAAFLMVFPEFVTLAQDATSGIAKGDKSSIENVNLKEASSYSEDEFNVGTEDTYTIDDPFEPFNRGMFTINKGLDTIILKPAAHVYREVVPEVGRDRVDSVFANMKEPVNILNSALQGDGDKVARSTGRFLVNTILGIGGLFDIASLADGLEPVNEDFGKTLGHYGVDTGPYIYLPLIGPSSPRDLVGKAADIASDPFIYSVHKDGVYVRDGVRTINTRESLLEVTDSIEETSIDEYSTIRSIYAQKRRGIRND